jgi:myo-inositol-1(or 4)-monophosphatase
MPWLMDKKAIEKQVVQLSHEVGAFIVAQRISSSDIETKSLNNLVSFVDKEAEKMFVNGLSNILPEAGFIAEEGTVSPSENEFTWIIDPLDGTTNFIHGIPAFCTSVALKGSKELLVGVVYDPVSKETFHASAGGGAFLNETLIKVSSTGSLSQSLIATGFPYDDFGFMEAYLNLFRQLCTSTRGLRRVGSAAIDLAWTACGRFDAFYEYGLNPWDVAAGTLIVREAGGKVTGFDNVSDPVVGSSILATNVHLHEEMSKTIERYFLP